MDRRALSILLSLAFLLASSVALAQVDEKAAKTEFEKATKHFEARQFEAALPYYRRAYELSGHRPSTIRALAQCERSLNLYDDAITHFQEYLATRPEEAPQIVETLGFLQELRAAAEKGKTTPSAPGDPRPPGVPQATTSAVPKSPTAPSTSPSPTPRAAAASNAASTPAPLPRIEPSVAPPAATTQAPPLEPEGGPSTLTIVLIAVAAAAAVGGGIAIGLALSGEEDPYGGTANAVLRR